MKDFGRKRNTMNGQNISMGHIADTKMGITENVVYSAHLEHQSILKDGVARKGDNLQETPTHLKDGGGVVIDLTLEEQWTKVLKHRLGKHPMKKCLIFSNVNVLLTKFSNRSLKKNWNNNCNISIELSTFFFRWTSTF